MYIWRGLKQENDWEIVKLTRQLHTPVLDLTDGIQYKPGTSRLRRRVSEIPKGGDCRCEKETYRRSET